MDLGQVITQQRGRETDRSRQTDIPVRALYLMVWHRLEKVLALPFPCRPRPSAASPVYNVFWTLRPQ